MEPDDSDRNMNKLIHDSSQLRLKVSNYGVLGDSNAGLEYPPGNGINYLYLAGPWISAKKYRRDPVTGLKYYWTSPNPNWEDNGVVLYGSPGWQPWMIPAIDTLTTVAFDGDANVYELLPAYNLLDLNNPSLSVLYNAFNHYDVALRSHLGLPGHREFQYPDPEGNYAFTIPLPQNPSPDQGFETITGFEYDFSPFGMHDNPDWGSNMNTNAHYPLGIAVEQRSYAWNLQTRDRFIILDYLVHNTSTQDTLFDFCYAAYIDPDCYPIAWGSGNADEDISGYCPQHDFAYGRDADGDSGLTTDIVAAMLIDPANPNLSHSAWTWSVGYGPWDYNPLSYANFYGYANEKYRLMVGDGLGSPDYVKMSAYTADWEQNTPSDTRFLLSRYSSNPNQRLNLPPGASYRFYIVIFMGNDLPELKSLSTDIRAFIAGNMVISPADDLTCIPYITSTQEIGSPLLRVHWHSYTNPDHFIVYYKLDGAPASTWQSVQVSGNARLADITLSPETWYDIKVGSVYMVQDQEVYLESQTVTVPFGVVIAVNDPLAPVLQLGCRPNPLTSFARIDCTLSKADRTSLCIYNLRGQRIKRFEESVLARGYHSFEWDARDDAGKQVPNGIYILKLESGKDKQTRMISVIR